ncbi:hypothetical protein DXG01_006918 [Tephrocybe rancida]|nr:hypothetical protein DXG01_006918 [Tephrocybe rancida]
MLRWERYFMISVVLDDGAYVDFSGIRILILENSSLDIRLSEVDLEDHVSFRRTALQRKLRLPQLVLDKSRSPTQNAKPLCTVAFYLHPGTDGPPYYGTILLEPVPDLVYASANTPRKVVYDSIYPCNAGSHSVCQLFCSNFNVSPFHTESDDYTPTVFGPSLCIRILPITRDRSRKSPLLPRTILCQIFREALWGRRWRSNMLAIGLVCKDWAHIFDVFFGWHRGTLEGVSILALARSLALRPERGCLLRTISLYNFRETLWRYDRRPVSGDDISSMVMDERVTEALIDILQLAPLVQTINLGNLRTPLRADVMRNLAMLKEVETASVSSAASFLDDKLTPPFAMKDIQALVANWAGLRHLTMIRWNDEDEATSLPSNVFGESSDISLRPEHPHFMLQTLTMQSGHLNGIQLR